MRWSGTTRWPFPSSSGNGCTVLRPAAVSTSREVWRPRHLALWRGNRLIAAAPAYLKDDSHGEFVFDWSWASAAERLGFAYYPKLIIAAPLTPQPVNASWSHLGRIAQRGKPSSSGAPWSLPAAKVGPACTCCFRQRRKPHEWKVWALAFGTAFNITG